MNTFQDKLNELKELFEIFEDPKDKFIQLMDMAKESTMFNKSDRNETNKIDGCTSQAWVVVKKNNDDTFSISTDSDSQIVKGLLSVLEKIFQNEQSKDILSMSSEEILSYIGLKGSVSSQRTNGFYSAVTKIQGIVK
jgi:cysteine desulfuration protein SufE